MPGKIKDFLQIAANRFDAAGIEFADQEAEHLMSWLLDCSTPELAIRLKDTLTADQEKIWSMWIRRRSQREPAQHIIGKVNFMGYDFSVTPGALIPRQETELLVVESIRLLKTSGPEARFVELGIGTGCVSISIALELPHAHGIGLEISKEALELAKQNLNTYQNQLQSRLHFEMSDGFTAMSEYPDQPFDLLVSNPPYIPAAEINTLQTEVREFDPHLALSGGVDGLDFYRMIAQQAKPFLKPDGYVGLGLGAGQWNSVKALFQKENWVVEDPVLDYNQIPRIFLAHQ